MDPEAAHEFTFRSLESSRALGLLPESRPLPGREITICGLTFPNPIGLAAGLDKNAEHLDTLGSFGFGFIEVGTVTPRPQAGNPKPRMFRLPNHLALINRLGFNNQGLEAFITNVQRANWVREKRGVLGLNIGKNADTPMEKAIDDYITGLHGVYPWADYVTVNISSPNTKNLRDLQRDDALHALLTGLQECRQQLADRHHRWVPLFLKIAPDLSNNAGITRDRMFAKMERDGWDAVIATNTTLSRSAVANDPRSQESGGLSGAPLLEQSNHVIRTLRAQLGPNIAIIGVGGVLNGLDARSKLQAGADLVQLYTGLIYRGPLLVEEAVRATRSA